MKRRTTMFVVAAATVAALSGCSVVGSGSSSDDDAKSFTYWSMWGKGEPQQVVLQKAIDEFTKETGIKVNVQWVGRDNVTKVTPTLNSAVSPVDLIDAAQRNIKSVLVSTGQDAPLGDVASAKIPGETDTVKSVIPKRYLDMVSEHGQPWMIPYEVVTSAFWYNGKAHPELTSAPPATWDDLIADLKTIKSSGEAPIALDGDIANYNLYYFAELAVRNTGPGQLLKAAQDKTGDSFKKPAFRDAAAKVQQLVDDGFFAPGYSSSKWPALEQKWAQNKAAVMYDGTWVPSESAGYAADGFDYRAFPMPKTTQGGDASQEVSFIGFGVPKKAKHASAAKKFIEFFMNKQRLAGISTTALNLTPRTDIAVPKQLTDVKKMIDDASAIHGQFDGIIDDEADWTNKVLIPLVNDLIFGKIKANAFIDELSTNSASYWKNNG